MSIFAFIGAFVTAIFAILGGIASVIAITEFLTKSISDRQAALLTNLRKHLKLVEKANQDMRPTLNFDRYTLAAEVLPTVPTCPDVLTEAVDEMPTLAPQIKSPGKNYINYISNDLYHLAAYWQQMHQILERGEDFLRDPANFRGVVEHRDTLDYQSRKMYHSLPEFVALIDSITTGGAWTRWKYREHGPNITRLLSHYFVLPKTGV